MPRTFYIPCLLFLAVLLAGCETYRAPVDDYTAGARTASPAQTAQAGDYVVRRGDTLYSIAFQFGFAYQQVAAWNGIRPPYTIYVGQRLRVSPPQAPQPVAVPSPSARTWPPVSPGQTPSVTPIPPVPASPSSTAPSAGVTLVPPPTMIEPVEPPQRGLLPEGPIQWRWPSDGPVMRGFAPSEPGRRGIDIGGRHGQTVLAAAGGQVVYSGSGLIGYGQLIIIKHNKSLLSAYAYNRKLLVKEGDAVRSGQPIAEMGGNPGDKPMLHFEIRLDGKPVNPLQYLPKR